MERLGILVVLSVLFPPVQRLDGPIGFRDYPGRCCSSSDGNLTDLCFDSRGGRFRFHGSGLKRCFGPFVRNPSSLYIFRAKTTASTPVAPGPRILDAKAMSDPHSAQDGPLTKGSPSAGTASTLDGNGILPAAFHLFSPYSRVLRINGC